MAEYNCKKCNKKCFCRSNSPADKSQLCCDCFDDEFEENVNAVNGVK